MRFYAAEALAYLDREEAAAVLAWAASNVSAFRWHALTALAAMDHVAAYETLNELLHVTSAETRYGAFRALRTRNAADPLVRGESLGGGFAYHVISSDGPPMIHFSKVQRPEIVLFGQHQPLVPPAFLCAGKDIMVKGLEDGRLRLTRFTNGDKEDQQETCDANVDQLIRSIVRLGGGYAEVVQALQEARQGGYLDSKVVVNAIARPDRDIPSRARMPRRTTRTSRRFGPPIRFPKCSRTGSRRIATRTRRNRATNRRKSRGTGRRERLRHSFMGRMSDWFAK